MPLERKGSALFNAALFNLKIILISIKRYLVPVLVEVHHQLPVLAQEQVPEHSQPQLVLELAQLLGLLQHQQQQTLFLRLDQKLVLAQQLVQEQIPDPMQQWEAHQLEPHPVGYLQQSYLDRQVLGLHQQNLHLDQLCHLQEHLVPRQILQNQARL
jgi:hypothetical protein